MENGMEEIVTTDKIEVTKNGCVLIRTNIVSLKNNEQISSKFHRRVIVPGDDFSNESDEIKEVCASIHTAEVVSLFKAAVAAQGI
jgi:hypothetical protein